MEVEISQSTLLEKKEELIIIKEEIKRAKENATQSWLDSRPLIDELERLKSCLAIAETKNFESKTLISNLEAELTAVESSIKSKKYDELDASKAIGELNQAIDQLREETETLKRYTTGDVRQKKLRLKQVVRVKRQKLRYFQLRLVAVKRETEAHDESTNEALRYLSLDETEVIRLSHEEYEALKRKAVDVNSLTSLRVSVAEEERVVAEKSRDLAMAKWRELKKKRLVKREIRREYYDDNKRIIVEEAKKEEELELGEENKMIELYDPNLLIVRDEQPQAQPCIDENYDQFRPKLMGKKTKTIKKNKNTNNDKKKTKKKVSFFYQLRFLLRVIKKLFR